jgi:hypothetical protein
MVAFTSPMFNGEKVAALLPIMLWAGLYFGANAGYIWAGDTNTSFSYEGSGRCVFLWRSGALPANANLNSRGLSGGGQVGDNYHLHEKIAAGLEADLQGTAVGVNSVVSQQGSPAGRWGESDHAGRTFRQIFI